MKTYHSLAACGLLYFALLTPLTAATSNTAEQTVQAYIDNLREQNWQASAALFDSASLQQIRELLLPVIIDDDAADFRTQLFGDKTDAAIQALPAKDFFAVVLEKVLGNKLDPKLTAGDITIVGSVSENNTEHVLLRVKSQGSARLSDWKVISVTQQLVDNKKHWRLLLSERFHSEALKLKMKLLAF